MLHRLYTWGAHHPWTFVGIAIVMTVFGLIATAFAAVRIPVDYFTRSNRPLPLAGKPQWLRVAARIGLNILGIVVILLGLILSLPGIPGQGILTILLGFMLVDIPGRRRIELALVRRDLVHRGLNRLRTRFGKPPVIVPTAAVE